MGSNFLCGRPYGAYPLPLSAGVHLCLTPPSPPHGRHKWMAPRNLRKSMADEIKIKQNN